MNNSESIIPKHGGYKKLLSYQKAELIFDITVHFCKKYVPFSDRTHDQMVQSARSAFQNIAEGSVDSGVSKKSELKLTGIAIGCMDELYKDYEKYLETKKLAKWKPEHPALLELKDRRVSSLDAFRAWAKDAWEASEKTLPPDQIAANGLLTLINLDIFLTKKQLAAIEKSFQEEGGITERIYRLRKERRDRDTGTNRD